MNMKLASLFNRYFAAGLFGVCLISALAVLSGTAAAATATFPNGETVTYTGTATASTSGNDLILKFTSGTGTLVLSKNYIADILVVGGGGGGGSSRYYSNSRRYGAGGNGGGVSEVMDRPVSAQTLTITVGAGGTGGAAGNNAGGNGGASSVSGTVNFEMVTGTAGTGGRAPGTSTSSDSGTGASGSGTAGVTSQITGATYGVGGAAANTNSGASDPTNAAANTGNGGQAARRPTSSTNRAGADGGSGIVVIRIKAAAADYVCQIGSTKYTTLEAAIAAAQAGNTIELLKDITFTSDVAINKNVTITSESGHTYTLKRGAGQYALNVTANVAFSNVVVDGGITWANNTISGITVTGSSASQGKSLITVANGAALTLGDGATIQNFWGRKMDANSPDTYAAINNAGTLVINDGAVLKNIRHRAYQQASYAAQMGGAIYSTGTVTMNGGTIENCYSVGAGGAIYAAGGTVEIKGGTITNCAAAQGGGAVYVASGTLKVSGDPTVSNNNLIADSQTSKTLNNIQPTAATQISLAGEFTGSVGVSYPASNPDGAQFGTVASGSGANNFFYDGLTELTGAVENATLVWGEPVCRIGDVTYVSLTAALAAANDNDTIVLLKDVVLNNSLSFNKPITLTSEEGSTFTVTRNAANSDKTLTIGSNVVFKNITFDGDEATGSCLVSVAANGNLTLGDGATIQNVYCSGAQAVLLNDSSAVLNIEKGATISNCKNAGVATTGGAIRVNSGTVNMKGGTITGCANENGDGGAIYVNEGDAVVNVTGGTISNCSASGAGGAITANEGIVNIYGGVITGNTAGTNGGAVQYGQNGGILAGGTIKGNKAGETAGGVYVKGVVKVGGSPKVVDNTVNGTANNLVPTSDTQIQLRGTLTGRIGVSYSEADEEGEQFGAFVSGEGANNFVYDGGTYAGEISNGTLVWSASATPGPMPDDDDPDKPVDPIDPMYNIRSPEVRPVSTNDFVASGAVVEVVGDDVVLIYTNPAAVGTLEIPSYAHARVMAVGGGAAGGTVGVGTEQGAGGGGGAGGMSEMTTTLMPGEYQIQVGAGAKRVDSYVQSWVGNNGGFSALVNPQGTYVTSAKGGGGGGAPKDNGAGADGGSGGGGSWWGVTTSGGSYTDGYGWYGAKPENSDIGGGGGGAAVASTEGAGKADGTGGAGRASDITGESVIYSAGGNGGDRSDPGYVPQDGATPGSGGDGASLPGPAGAGADGIVVVRLVDFFDMVKVPVPPYTETFNWAEGETPTAFDVTKLPQSYQDAIASIEGMTNVECSVSTVDGQTVTNGLGRMSFTVTLKDGYVWDDGSEHGFNAPKTFFWRVREENVVGNALAEVTKTVEWSENTNAVISITAHTTPEKRKELPNVLFLGTMCSSHSLTEEKIRMAIDAAAENAKHVDYYLYKKANQTVTGSLEHGQKMAENAFGSAVLSGGQHHSINAFYNCLYTILSNPDTRDFYDYIIFEFDGTRLAHEYTTANSHEQEVVDWLKPYYADEKVILVVDNDYAGKNQNPEYTGDAMEPWSQEYWRPNTYMYSAGSKNLGFTELKGLVGMFYPDDYQYYAGKTAFSQVSAPYIESKTFKPLDVDSQTYYAGRRYDVQTTYENGNELAEYIRNRIHAIEYTVNLDDNICLAKGLKLNQVYGCWTTNQTAVANTVADYVNEVPQGWYPLTAGENLFPSEEGVEIKLPAISTESWIRLWLDVSDTGPFLSSIEATYNTQTGLWQKDPNNGPVVVQTTSDGSQKVIAEDQAATDVQWSFKGYQLTGMVMSNTNGLNTGDILVNGYSTNWVAVGENTSPQAVFRGAPGYILDRLVVDGEDVDFSIVTSDWLFQYINADHDVKVWYKPYFVEDPPPPVTGPVTNLYDGTAYGPTVTNVNFTEDIPYEWFPVYSMESNGVYSVDGGQTNVVWGEDGTPQPTNVYVRIAVMQPGYEEPVILDNWTGVNTVTILPREITIQYENYVQTDDTRKETDFDWHLVESLNVTNQLVEGDYVTETGSFCSEYPDKGEHTVDTISTDPANVVVHNPDGSVSGNYIVNVLPGDYYRPDRQLVADAEGVEKIYDGDPETIEVKVLNPTNNVPTTSDLRNIYGYAAEGAYTNIRNISSDGPVIKYSLDGVNYIYDEPPTFTDAGTNTVYYKVDYTFSFQHRQGQGYSWVTDTVVFDTCYGSADVIIHPRPVTVTADSAEKPYDGTPLTDGGYTVAEPTDVTGFVEGEGATFAMTDGSTITDPGTHPNVIDPSKTQTQSGTKLSNYVITYEPGTLKVTGEIDADPVSVEKIYDGQASNIGVTVTDYKGDPLDPSEYTIKYSQYPNVPDSWTTDNPTFTNVGVSNVVYYVVEKDGYPPVEGKAYVTIWPREIVVTADDKSKYVGEEDPELTWTVTSGTREGLTEEEVGILPGEEDLVESLVKNDPKHNIEREPGEEITPPGEPGYPITPSGSEYLGNYHVTYVDGELTIKDELKVTDEDAVKIYDGVPTNITVTVTTRTSDGPLDPGTDYKITYFCDPSDPDNLPDGPDGWSDDVAYTNATKGTPDLYPGTNKVWYVVEADGFDPVTNFAYVVIDPRPVTILIGKEKPFGEGTTTNLFQDITDVSVSTNGFIEGEGIAYLSHTFDPDDKPVEGELKEVDPKTVDTTLQENTLPQNYIITYYDGRLLAATVDIRAYEGADGMVVEFQTTDERGSRDIEVYAMIDGEWRLIGATGSVGSGDNLYRIAVDGLEVGETYDVMVIDDEGHSHRGDVRVERFAIEMVRLNRQGFNVRWASEPGATYLVQRVERLGDDWSKGASWEVVAEGSVTEFFVDTADPFAPKAAFFRVVLVGAAPEIAPRGSDEEEDF